jgi:hypothetical protein
VYEAVVRQNSCPKSIGPARRPHHSIYRRFPEIKTNSTPPGNLKLGILANEFLGPDIGRLGGFGWAARSAGRALNIIQILCICATQSPSGKKNADYLPMASRCIWYTVGRSLMQ